MWAQLMKMRLKPEKKTGSGRRVQTATDCLVNGKAAPDQRQESALTNHDRLLFGGRLTLFTKGQHLANDEKHHRDGFHPGADGGLAPDVDGVPQAQDSERRCQAGEPNPSSASA